MGRPAKSVNVLSSYSQTKAETDARREVEERLRGKELPEAPSWLNEDQKKIFDIIVDSLKDSEILAKHDVWIIQNAAIAIDRLQSIEWNINEQPESLFDKEMQSARNGYMRDFFRACNELCLSPQARAKIAIAVGQKQEKPIEKIMKIAEEL